jgi:hypothetical protein
MLDYIEKVLEEVEVMKNKYQRLTREEKKQVVKDFRAESEKNNNYMSVLNRMLILGIIGLIYGIASMLGDLFFFKASVLAYIIDGIVIAFSVFLIVQHFRIKGAVLNYYLVNPKAKEIREAVEDTEEEVKESTMVMIKDTEKKPTKKKTTKKTSTAKKSTTSKKTTSKSTSTKKTTTKKTTKKSDK